MVAKDPVPASPPGPAEPRRLSPATTITPAVALDSPSARWRPRRGWSKVRRSAPARTPSELAVWARPELRADDAFVARHIGPSDEDQRQMLAALGLASLKELIDLAVPAAIRWPAPLDLGPPTSEIETLARLREIAGSNELYTSVIGMGYYGSECPMPILRNIVEDPGWYTAYTPYQPEISQGRLEALVNFQTMVSDLTTMEVANASLLDEATAAAEAMAMCRRLNPAGGATFLVDSDCHPQTIAVIRTRAEPLGIDVRLGDPSGPADEGVVFGALLQYPGSSGEVRDLTPVIERAHEAGALTVVAADLLALCLLRSPGEMGADIAVGTTQRFGMPPCYGGPHAGYIATSSAFQRALPGRLVGVSRDAGGRLAYRLALQTREQHIRREKATSNICTASVLPAVISAMFAVYHGPDGLYDIATRVHRLTTILAAGLLRSGIDLVTGSFFDTITVRVPERAQEVAAAARQRHRINLRVVDGDTLGISLDETTTPELIEQLWDSFGIGANDSVNELDLVADDALPPGMRRTSAYLTHPVFSEHRSETEIVRYMRRLRDKDIALDRSMIALGSCTMKLSAATSMAPITWPEFLGIHPFAPVEQARGYQRIFVELEAMLAEITGYDAVSLQPNAGSQGELAGLLAIRAYQRANGEGARTVCLIPASAHGTNASTAAMAGLSIEVVACDERGNVDVDDLRAKTAIHSADLSCLIVTYPSTHGVFEAEIIEICHLIHEAGGQVYLDGANLNALVGVAKPGKFGADVSHLNLHKTFGNPHGGGGPGLGPIGVRQHLAPYLPAHPVIAPGDMAGGAGPVSAAPWGSAGILPIAWSYITLMGASGLLEATQVAILSANYIAARLSPHFPLLYAGTSGLVAHECIIDLRPITRSTGLTVDDVSKRLIDYGFHAPTVSFPVPGTLMIEPTESEPLAEIDRFCDALIAIRAEIDRVADGTWPLDDNPLRNAPHPAEDLLTTHWDHPYDRALAAFPTEAQRADKYWVPVSRIDGVFGDRNVFCTCPPLDEA